MTKSKDPNYYRKRKDLNHNEVTAVLREDRNQVIDTNAGGNGFPDTLVIPLDYPMVVVLIEIKQPGKGLTEAELKFFAGYMGLAYWVDNPQDAKNFMKGAIEQWNSSSKPTH